MDNRREFLKKAAVLSAGTGLLNGLPSSIARALAINPPAGSTYLDAEHIVFLMQENRSFDHTYGSLQGVRGFNDPRCVRTPGNNLAWLQSNKEGETFVPFRFDIKNTKITWMDSLPHSWSNQVDARNNGKYDKWLDSKHSGKEEYATMPLTMGYYTRADIPFYYSLADAFTICDQNFCSSLTGTTPNRLYFWSGTIREKQDENVRANVWNEDATYDAPVNWKTFPERMEEMGVSWKIYQNELDIGVGLGEEEDRWLANFGDNPMGYFKQYNAKLHPEFIADLPKAAVRLATELNKKQSELSALPTDSREAEKIRKRIDWLKKRIVINAEDQKNCTPDKFEQLSQREKDLHQKAFVTNRNDPYYHQLTSLSYRDQNTAREVNIPKGDVLHQFRQDVQEGQLPTVSWLVAPETFSDHPSSAWYGAWYISEVMDILTRNPEVWKKTIFILAYDENDGYFDHVPPFVAPHPNKKDTGKTSKGIQTGVEYVANNQQQSIQDLARESSIGLGYRVPLVIASPWSRGGWINSQVFDHTSSLQFLEKFLSQKSGKKIEEENITAWRRTVCGDLTSSFRPYSGEVIRKPEFLRKNTFIESIHKAKFKRLPSNFRRLTSKQIALVNRDARHSGLLPAQEGGTRPSCALPYELYADGRLSKDRESFEIVLKAGNEIFGSTSAGSPFNIYSGGKFMEEDLKTWAYAVSAGDSIEDSWAIVNFPDAHYHLRVHGPNGFFREFSGDSKEPDLVVNGKYEKDTRNEKLLTGGLLLEVHNGNDHSIQVMIIDNAYKTGNRFKILAPKGSSDASELIRLDTRKIAGWYDFSVKIKGNSSFERRYAGRVETGKHGKSDPFMGRVI